MYGQEAGRIGRHPGKMPGGIKLVDCIHELQSVFRIMPITDRDREARAYIGILSITPPSTFSDRTAYVEQAYLTDLATETVRYALAGGTLPVWCDFNGQWIELDHEVMFAPNKWERRCVLGAGVYRTLNARRNPGDEQRLACEDATLWVKDDQWPDVRTALVNDRERRSGSVLGADWQSLLQMSKDHLAGCRPPADPAIDELQAPLPSTNLGLAPRQWSEDEMTAAIRQWTASSPGNNREMAWRDHFKQRQNEHGWDNRSFRAHWALALGSEGQPGRRPKSAQ